MTPVERMKARLEAARARVIAEDERLQRWNLIEQTAIRAYPEPCERRRVIALARTDVAATLLQAVDALVEAQLAYEAACRDAKESVL